MSEDDASWFAAGIAAGIQVAARHPEWAQAFPIAAGITDEANAIDDLVDSVPIAMVS
jgi:hypothetical protein